MAGRVALLSLLSGNLQGRAVSLARHPSAVGVPFAGYLLGGVVAWMPAVGDGAFQRHSGSPAIAEGTPGAVEALEKFQGDPDGRGSRRQRVAVAAYPRCAEAPWGGARPRSVLDPDRAVAVLVDPASPETLLPQGRKSETGTCHPESTFTKKSEVFTCQNFSWDWVSRPKSLVRLKEAHSMFMECQYPDGRKMHHDGAVCTC